jgi:hypothetical protein
MYHYVLRSDAWKAASFGARSLFMALKTYYSSGFQNNGYIFLSKRRAEDEFGLTHSMITRWYRELQHFGFIVLTQGPCLGVEGKGKAAKWRLTDEPYKGDPATNDFLKWDGVLFEPDEKQNPGLMLSPPWTDGQSTSGPTVSPPKPESGLMVSP